MNDKLNKLISINDNYRCPNCGKYYSHEIDQCDYCDTKFKLVNQLKLLKFLQTAKPGIRIEYN